VYEYGVWVWVCMGGQAVCVVFGSDGQLTSSLAYGSAADEVTCTRTPDTLPTERLSRRLRGVSPAILHHPPEGDMGSAYRCRRARPAYQAARAVEQLRGGCRARLDTPPIVRSGSRKKDTQHLVKGSDGSSNCQRVDRG
jgi:hypothetical protein